jgi:hypothetical protein
MNHAIEGKRLLPDTIAAMQIGVQVQTLRNWRYLGIGPPYIRIGARSIRYDLALKDTSPSGKWNRQGGRNEREPSLPRCPA